MIMEDLMTHVMEAVADLQPKVHCKKEEQSENWSVFFFFFLNPARLKGHENRDADLPLLFRHLFFPVGSD